MVAKDPKRRKEIARLGALAQHKKHGCLIPLEARRKGGRNSVEAQNREMPKYTEKMFKEWAEENGYEVYLHGFPDAIIVKDGKITLVEVKCIRGRLEDSQKKTFKLLRELGLKIKIWTAPTTR